LCIRKVPPRKSILANGLMHERLRLVSRGQCVGEYFDGVNVMALKIAVLLSGSGTTLQNLLDRSGAGELDLEFVCVIS